MCARSPSAVPLNQTRYESESKQLKYLSANQRSRSVLTSLQGGSTSLQIVGADATVAFVADLA